MKKIYISTKGVVLAVLCLLGHLSGFSTQFPVSNNSNSGAGSLNEAISLANANPGLDTVTFAIPEGNSMTIALTSSLPAISEALFINGYSQSGSTVGPIATRLIRINIDGVGLPGGTDIFTVSTTNVTIAGLAIYRATGRGIFISNAAAAHIWGNYIGTDSTGLTTGLGNSLSGIEGNVNFGPTNTGTIIGIDGNGVSDANEGNLICANQQDAVFFWRTESSRIAGNVIGFNKNGTGSGFGNGRNGILITLSSNSNIIGTNGDGISDNAEGNRIGNNNGRGIFMATISNNNIVAGNIVGLDASNVAAPNTESGIEINPGSNNRIGTNGDLNSDAIEGNTICSNTLDGIRIVGGDFFGSSNSNGNIIAGNSIGTNVAGNLVRGNGGFGVYILTNSGRNADGNIIGTNEDNSGDDVEGNRIANNQKGIVIDAPTNPSTSEGNRISRNSIYDNTQLGIDHGNNGISANDNGDPDTGPNNYFNFPVITRANVQGGVLVITGIASANAILEFYIADASGFEGRTYLFTAQEGLTYPNGITDDSTGTASYTDPTFGTFTGERFGYAVPVGVLPVSVPAGSIIVALAIKNPIAGNDDFSSSEFGPNFISTLPVRFTQFIGRADNGSVHLNWNTSQEINNSHFDIQRSGNGNDFETIGSVKALGGLNNAYQFTDNKTGTINFYRLKQVDINGTSTYSRVILIRGDLDKIGAKISPNPFRGNLNVSFQLSKEETVTIRLYNQSGQLIKQQITKANSGVNTVNVNDLATLPAGNYTLEVKTTELTHRQQIIKQ